MLLLFGLEINRSWENELNSPFFHFFILFYPYRFENITVWYEQVAHVVARHSAERLTRHLFMTVVELFILAFFYAPDLVQYASALFLDLPFSRRYVILIDPCTFYLYLSFSWLVSFLFALHVLQSDWLHKSSSFIWVLGVLMLKDLEIDAVNKKLNWMIPLLFIDLTLFWEEAYSGMVGWTAACIIWVD